MQHQQRGVLTLILVTSIAMTMLLSFGLFASYTTRQCNVVSIHSEYAQILYSAKVFAAR